MAERKDIPGAWQFPQGGVDPGEDLLAAFRREMVEEVGITRIAVLGRLAPRIYLFPPGASFRIAREYSGQRQVCFVGRTTQNPTLDDKEFRAAAWVPVEYVDRFNIPSFKRDIYLSSLRSAMRLVKRHDG